jgi:hypothetical protein
MFSLFVRMGLTLLLLCALSDLASAQATDSTHVGTVRGTVRSAQTLKPIAHAKIVLQETKLGAFTSKNGEYRIERVPVGHYIVVASASELASASQEIIVGSAHQGVLDFNLDEGVIKSDTITVNGSDVLAPINRVAVVSVTPFSIEDVNRYAAAFQDPSRMAENFAGVFGRGTTNNYIVVRGGSPSELLWRLDGIEIPDPNHFGRNGTSGGLISAINSAILGNSDFLTGAFPAEYGTRMSAVFDLHSRDGNTERAEGRAEISFNGIEAVGEGPIPFADGSSFLASYRHSTLSVLRSIGLLNYSNLPDFDDASLKLHFPLGQRDVVNATGLWGKANLNVQNTTQDELGSGSGLLVGGLDWQHLYSDEFIGHVKLQYVNNRYDDAIGNGGKEETNVSYTTARAELNYTPNLSHSLDIGVSAQRGLFSLLADSYYLLDTSTASNFYTAYLNWNWHLLPQLVLNTGVYSQFITLDTGSSIEPRASLAWSPSEQHTFSVAFGVHRQPEPLAFTQALHYVAGYTFRPQPDLMVKLEAYLKQYSNVPVHAREKDFYSYLNDGNASRINLNDLVSTGKGKNYGAEFTLLKHYSSGYYVTGTASIVRQEFVGSDGNWHFGSFDNQYILNLVTGYDIALSSTSTLTLSEKFTVAGGGAYTQYDLARSTAGGRPYLDSANAFGARNDPYVRLDLNAEFTFNFSRSSLTIYASVLNALNLKNITYRNIDFDQNNHAFIRYEYDLPILPIVGIRYEF